MNPVIEQKDFLINHIQLSQLENYGKVYEKSITPGDRELFWEEEAKEVSWMKFPSKDNILDSSNIPFYTWFNDGTMNMCYNCLDKHIDQNRGKIDAIIWESAYLNKSSRFTYWELFIYVNKLSKILLENGVQKGDFVVIYMPMIPEGLIAMLACIRIGAIHSVVFGGFAAPELAERIKDSRPKIIITASGGIEPRKRIAYYPIILEALKLVNQPKMKILLVLREDVCDVSEYQLKQQGNTLIYQEEIAKLSDSTYVVPVEVKTTHPLFVLYTSGTTGIPKGIVHDTGGFCVAANYTMKNIMNIHPGDIVFSTSDIGWIVGHVFIVYGPFIRGATTVILEGKPIGTPNCGKCFEIMEKYQVKAFYTTPTALRAIKREDYDCKIIKKYNLTTLESIHMAGERCDPDTFNWIQEGVGKEKLINDQWWQTESGWPICSNNINICKFPSKPGSATRPNPGFIVKIVQEDTYKEIYKPNELGMICIALPPPPGFMLTLWGNDQAYKDKYISKDNKYYITGDCGYFDEDGYFYIMARLDDMIKIAGHRLSTGRMEEVLIQIKEVTEAAVISAYDSLKGELPFAFLVCKKGISESEYCRICECAKEKIVNEIGAICRLKGAMICQRLPKTRSGKIIRSLLKNIVNNQELSIPSTIEDISVITEIIERFKLTS